MTYRVTTDADPRRLYHNVLVAIDPARKLNNGQPTAVITWLDALDPRPGDRVVHVGAGVGYYSERVQCPDLPPDFSSSSMAAIDAPRSTPLTMS